MLKRLTGGCCALLFTLSCSTIPNYTSPTLIAEQSIEMDSVEFKNFKKDTYVKIQELKRVQNENFEREEIIEEVEVTNIIVEEEIIEDNKEYWTFEVSYYCGCWDCTQNGNNITASGTYATQGRTIALPTDIPFGTEVYIEDVGYFINEDTGGFIQYTYDDYGNLVMRVDVYLEDHNECYERGRHYSNGYIIRSE